jgi:hypothetical protein
MIPSVVIRPMLLPFTSVNQSAPSGPAVIPYKLDQMYSAALKLDAAQRASYLRQARGADDALCAEVESLLSHQDPLGSFPENPAIEAITITSGGQLCDGQTLGPYRIEGQFSADRRGRPGGR